MFADLEARRLLYATEGKDASTWERFAAELPKHKAQAEQIKQVSIDMSPEESMGLFRRNPDNLNEEQSAHLVNLKQANLITAKAYQMRLTLQNQSGALPILT